MSVFNDFADDLLPSLPGAQSALVQHEWSETVVDFLERSLLWDHTNAAISITAANPFYSLSDVANTRAVKIIDAWVDGTPLDVTNEVELRRIYGASIQGTTGKSWQTVTEDPPKYYYGIGPEENMRIRLVPIPANGGGSLKTQVRLTYLRGVTTIADWIFQRHKNAIVDGTLASMFKMKSKPWSDPSLFSHHNGLYEQAINEKNIESEGKGYSRMPLRSTPVFR